LAGTKLNDFCCRVELPGCREAEIVRAAELEISDAEFGNRLKDMRVWLEAKRFAPSTFTYLFLLPGMKVRIAFDTDDEAAAFAIKFGGILVDASDLCRGGSEYRDGVGLAAAGHPG
jgi:hypothetical protein